LHERSKGNNAKVMIPKEEEMEKEKTNTDLKKTNRSLYANSTYRVEIAIFLLVSLSPFIFTKYILSLQRFGPINYKETKSLTRKPCLEDNCKCFFRK
jgi:hypothetical protein